MERVLRAIGLVPIEEVDNVASSLYMAGHWESEDWLLSLVCFGDWQNKHLALKYPDVPQITWKHILSFVYERFREYRYQKASHPQWDQNGKNLWESAHNSSNLEDFREKVIIISPKN